MRDETSSNIPPKAQEPLIAISEAAANQAINLWNDYRKSDSLRLYLEGKGCDGFFYGVSFDSKTEGDVDLGPIAGSRLQLITDQDTLEFVKGSKIDWVQDERGTGFLVENPRHSKYRGKFFKRDVWKQKLIQRKNELN
ncbi:MAG: iron-sulfur cluster biosynthesis family protein [Pseudomonadota bacterium]